MNLKLTLGRLLAAAIAVLSEIWDERVRKGGR
jgi:predicted outer membrane lipoprotein